MPWRSWEIGVAICYDIQFPEVARLLELQGANLICVPAANMVGFDALSDMLLAARGLENQVYVAYANLSGNDEQFQYNGLSVLIGPDSEVRAGGIHTCPTVVPISTTRPVLTGAISETSSGLLI